MARERAISCSMVVPIYNDAALARAFCDEFERVSDQLSDPGANDRVELIFVDDGSEFGAEKLVELANDHHFVRVIRLSRNFGQHIAVSCGYEHASGRYVGMMNVDMEDPPDQIPKLLRALQEGAYDIVYGLRETRHSPWLDRVTSRLFNLTLNWLTGVSVPHNVSTLRLMNRRFVNAFNRLEERSRYIPGLETWLGFKRGYVATRSQPRREGRSSYTLRRRLMMAGNSILAFSDLPLKAVSMTGLIVSMVGFLMVAALYIGRMTSIDFRPGYASTLAVIVFLGGIQILGIGMSGLYIGRIQRETQRRPLYVIADTYPPALEERRE